MEHRVVEWFQALSKFNIIMIFGAAKGAQDTYRYVKEAGSNIECFLVSRREGNPSHIEDKLVKTFDEISINMKEQGLVIISQIYENNDAMEKILFAAGFRNMIASTTQIAPIMTEELWERYCRPVLGKRQCLATLWSKEIRSISNGKKMRIYAVTSQGNIHKANKRWDSRYVQYIQAGASLAAHKMCEITDDVGDNISELNPYFCELTAGYWIYKNDNVNDYVGLYHYSRGLDITDKQIEDIVESGIDVVLPTPLVMRHELITRGMREGASIIFEAIGRVCPEYQNAAERYFFNRSMFAGNLFFAKRNIFCQYYEWMFKVIDGCMDIIGSERVSPRIWGYFGEHLTNIFFIRQIPEYLVLYADVKYML